LTLYGISKKKIEKKYIKNYSNKIDGLVYFSSKISRIKDFSSIYKN